MTPENVERSQLSNFMPDKDQLCYVGSLSSETRKVFTD